jgi:hypothetical protein
MAREYSNKVTLRPPPGSTGIQTPPIDIISVQADPNGVIGANAGSLALLVGGGTMWRSAGGTVWNLLPSVVGTWTIATLINGWVWNGVGTHEPAFRLSGTGNVELRGFAFNPAGVPGGGAMFTLPLAFRPPVDITVASAYSFLVPPSVPGTGSVGIFTTTGDVIPDTAAPAGSTVMLDGVSFSILL